LGFRSKLTQGSRELGRGYLGTERHSEESRMLKATLAKAEPEAPQQPGGHLNTVGDITAG